MNDSIPWVILGDFNTIRFGDERWPECDITQGMTDFNDCIRAMDYIEPTNTGCSFTWSIMYITTNLRK